MAGNVSLHGTAVIQMLAEHGGRVERELFQDSGN